MSPPDQPLLVLPRPGNPSPAGPPIPAPPESAFTTTFGPLLPPATYLTTPHGRCAYYSLPPLPPTTKTTNPAAPTTPRILLIHGVQTPALGLLPLAQALHTAHPHTHLLLPDLWGHGLTDTPLEPHVPGLFHALLDAVLADAGWSDGPVHLVGYSFGGALATTYASAHPERVGSVAVVAPAGLIKSEGLGEEGRGYWRGGPGTDEGAAREWAVNDFLGGTGVVPADWRERVGRGEVVAEKVREWGMREHGGHAASVVGVVRDGGVVDGEGGFRGVRGPRFAVLGGDDGVCGVGDLGAVGWGERVRVIEGVGHDVVRARAGEVAGLIGGFWRGLEGWVE